MTVHFVYIAASDGLMTFTTERFDRFAIKVGASGNPSDREAFLSGRNPQTGDRVPACCGFDDWKVVARKLLATKADAEDLEARFKDAFDPFLDFVRDDPEWHRPVRGNGESDVVLLPSNIFNYPKRHELDADVRDLLIAGRSNMFSAIRPSVGLDDLGHSDEEEEWQRERELREQDELDDIRENLNRDEARREEGSDDC
jgi:hypothetical protein